MRQFTLIIAGVFLWVFAFSLGAAWEAWYYNDEGLFEANQYKRECLESADSALRTFDALVDKHADDGTYDDIVDELNDAGYYKFRDQLDSLYTTQL